MNITFYGSAREVTGSLALVKTEKYKFLVDCGFFQGDQNDYFRNKAPFNFDPKDIDFVLITHSHMDHCGKLPWLVKNGFKNNIYCTSPTKDIMYYILLDAVGIMKYNKKKYKRDTIYEEKDVEKTISLVKTFDYNKPFSPKENIVVNFKNSGHILGSATVEISEIKDDRTEKIVFTGDMGKNLSPIVNDTEFVNGCDHLIIESTYGNKNHKNMDTRKNDLLKAIKQTINNNGSVLIPSFAIERTEELLYDLNELFNEKKLSNVPVFLDSPLAKNVLSVYRKYQDWFDHNAQQKIKSGDDIFDFPGFKIIDDTFESEQLIKNTQAKIVLAGSGMMSGGRIINYLPLYLTQKNNTVVFVSYQAKDTLGEKLVKGQKTINVDGKKLKVKAQVLQIPSYTSHADQKKLKSFVKNIKHPHPKNIFINHGNIDQSLGLKQCLSLFSKAKLVIPENAKEYKL